MQLARWVVLVSIPICAATAAESKNGSSHFSVSAEKARQVAKAELDKRHVDTSILNDVHTRGPLTYGELLRLTNNALVYREHKVRKALSGKIFWRIAFMTNTRPVDTDEKSYLVLRNRPIWSVFIAAKKARVLYVEAPGKW